MLLHKDGITAVAIYKQGIGAIESRRWSNWDGGIHVAEAAGAHELNPLRDYEDKAYRQEMIGGLF
jgi:hypothetical protein